MKKIDESVICAGFGGQGVMVLGKYIANVGMERGLNVTWLPAYGIEVRGGTAHSMVRISSSKIGSPIPEKPTVAIIMNTQSLQKFEGVVKEDGLIILNSSMCDKSSDRKDIDIVSAPLTEDAIKLGNVRVANMIAAGIFAARRGVFSREDMIKVIEQMAGYKKEIVQINIKAVEIGMMIGAKCK
ncbi:MAG TPA: 2-oxoacid:acceptor oxidoreductase family protein [Candidatus Omnitrophota bacterium]|nr:2-oxoacid:acceptor oxidoreductase family protein [Candidatus Omnitrophota bacterium]HPS19789.1 2-oxoacid:acceptor oxidoreductase family protein [Candidatus Omnitrophota bacterium]